MIVIALVLFLGAMLPLGMTLFNLPAFSRALNKKEALAAAAQQSVSIIIPARNEATNIANSLETIIQSSHQNWEVLVIDDHSEDATRQIVTDIAKQEPRIRCLASDPLPEGWNGKQHACWQGANHAKFNTLLFLDADVRLSNDAVTRCVAHLIGSQTPLISGFPFQETETFWEKLLIPLMHVILLGYLPIARMRSTSDPGFAAGCGQLFVADRVRYMLLDGHRAIWQSRHDGIQLPRKYRKSGYLTDIFDASDIARCRMYRSTSQVMQGLSKNAYEGIGNPKLILIFTLLLGAAFVLPVFFLVGCLFMETSIVTQSLLLLATLASFATRTLIAKHFQQPMIGAMLNPLAISMFLWIQWKSLVLHLLGSRSLWRGRE